uniref:CDK5 regulatory subunit-associated protein 3 n=2 Tax=Lonchura striata TaxID=40157 RepID=UPI000B4D3743
AAGPAGPGAGAEGPDPRPAPVPLPVPVPAAPFLPCPPQVAPQDYRNVPIDIQTSKLMDWLQDRRHCGCRWPAQVAQVRERIRAALQDMPEHPEIRALLQGSYLHYFHCLRIVEILKGTEASTKNLFGRYSSQRMKDWQEIVSLYEKDNAYL